MLDGYVVVQSAGCVLVLLHLPGVFGLLVISCINGVRRIEFLAGELVDGRRNHV